MFQKDTGHVYRVAELKRHAWLDHGFGTRLSGNWIAQPLVTLRQVHSSTCLVADGATGVIGEGDAVIGDRPGRYLGIRTADCIPILLVDERVRAVAAIHAGWRGTAAEIAVRALAAMRDRFGSRAEDIEAAIGPGICSNCYEVGPDVASRFQRWFPERRDLDRKTFIDLAEANRRQLAEAGVRPSSIYGEAPCTACRPDEFHSHRLTPGRPGRMLSAVAVIEATRPGI